jgi:adenylate kinase family enzyme
MTTQPPALFRELRRVKVLTSAFLNLSVASLANYYDAQSGGFFHRLDVENAPGDFSKASSATAVNFLVATDRWVNDPWAGNAQELANRILAVPWQSAGLPAGNPFTTAFLLEALAALRSVGATVPTDDVKVSEGLTSLKGLLAKGQGIHLDPYQASAYVTQVAVRALRAWDQLGSAEVEAVLEWSWNYVRSESVTLHASPRDSDALELAYALVLVTSLSSGLPPADREIVRYSIQQLFEAQLPDGSWPRGRPIFHYPDVGNAYCYEYELLVQLLATREIKPFLHDHLAGLMKAADAIDQRKYPLSKGYGWSSGHHRHILFPESWSTASVLHSCHLLNRFLAEETRQVIFDYVGATYLDVQSESQAKLPDDFLDSSFTYEDETKSLKDVIENLVLRPLIANLPRLRQGDPLPREVATSAILFGPPGTSKTQLARLIAQALGWPLLVIDPSHLLRNGSQNLHAEVYILFKMLTSTEEIVVLFDEFDELVRERKEDAAQESRFLTTAMLPRLQELSTERRLVFLFATNHLEVFDVAISRPGRFDVIIPVMPPTAAEKLKKWNEVATRLQELGAAGDSGATRNIELLTFDEFGAIAGRLASASSKDELLGILERAVRHGTMKSSATAEVDWEASVMDRFSDVRLPSE